MSTELQIAPVDPTSQHRAWIAMAEAKNDIVADLTQAELNAQSMLVVDAGDYKKIDDALAVYRKAHADMVDLRKSFTSQVEAGVIQPLMAFEKRVDPKGNETYQRLSQASLSLRKAEADKVARVNQVNAELAQFKAHCTAEFFRIAAEYRTTIRKGISGQYEFWLNEGKMPDLEKLRSALVAIEVPSVSKFRPTLITKEQMAEVYSNIHKPDFTAIFEEMMEEMQETFANFSSDLANKSAALAKQKEAEQLAAIAEKQQLAEESAINTLIATSEAVVIDAPRVRQTYTITVIESEAWAKTVVAGFITNLPHLGKYIRVKSWAKLTIGQMAEYLAKHATDSDIKVQGLTYEVNEK